MEPLFVTECKFDNKSYYEMVPILRKKPSRNFLIFTPVIILIMIIYLRKVANILKKPVLKGYLFIKIHFKFRYIVMISLLPPLPTPTQILFLLR